VKSFLLFNNGVNKQLAWTYDTIEKTKEKAVPLSFDIGELA